MLFQGQEMLEDEWFRDTDPIDWSKAKEFAGVLRMYRDLIRLRLNRENTTIQLFSWDIWPRNCVPGCCMPSRCD